MLPMANKHSNNKNSPQDKSVQAANTILRLNPSTLIIEAQLKLLAD